MRNSSLKKLRSRADSVNESCRLENAEMLLEKQVRENLDSPQAYTTTHDVLVQAECRVHAAEEAPEQFAIESVNMYHHALRNAAAGQEAVVMAETSEYNRLEPRGCLNT